MPCTHDRTRTPPLHGPLAICTPKSASHSPCTYSPPPCLGPPIRVVPILVLKLLVIACVVVWLVGLLLGRKRRIIKNSLHLTQLLIWLMLVFLVSAYLPRAPFFREHMVARAVVLLLWFAASFKLSSWLAARMDKSGN